MFRTYREKAHHLDLSPGASGSIGDSERLKSLHRLGTSLAGCRAVEQQREGRSAGGGPRPHPRAGRSLLEQLATQQRCWQEGGKEGEGKEEEGREGWLPLFCTYQSPCRSKVPAVHSGGGCTSPQRSRCSSSLTRAAEHCSRLLAPLYWNSAQPLCAAPQTRSSEIGMSLA